MVLKILTRFDKFTDTSNRKNSLCVSRLIRRNRVRSEHELYHYTICFNNLLTLSSLYLRFYMNLSIDGYPEMMLKMTKNIMTMYTVF